MRMPERRSTVSLRSGSEMLMRIRGVKPVRSKGRLYFYHPATGERIHADPDDLPQSQAFG